MRPPGHLMICCWCWGGTPGIVGKKYVGDAWLLEYKNGQTAVKQEHLGRDGEGFLVQRHSLFLPLLFWRASLPQGLGSSDCPFRTWGQNWGVGIRNMLRIVPDTGRVLNKCWSVCLLLRYYYHSQRVEHMDLDFSYEGPPTAVGMLVWSPCRPLFGRWHISTPTLANVMWLDPSVACFRFYCPGDWGGSQALSCHQSRTEWGQWGICMGNSGWYLCSKEPQRHLRGTVRGGSALCEEVRRTRKGMEYSRSTKKSQLTVLLERMPVTTERDDFLGWDLFLWVSQPSWASLTRTPPRRFPGVGLETGREKTRSKQTKQVVSSPSPRVGGSSHPYDKCRINVFTLESFWYHTGHRVRHTCLSIFLQKTS